MTDAPVDCPTDEAVYEKLIRDKFRAVLSAAQEDARKRREVQREVHDVRKT